MMMVLQPNVMPVLVVVNKAPTIEPLEMWVDGVYLEQLDGMWHLDEYQTVTLKVQGK